MSGASRALARHRPHPDGFDPAMLGLRRAARRSACGPRPNSAGIAAGRRRSSSRLRRRGPPQRRTARYRDRADYPPTAPRCCRSARSLASWSAVSRRCRAGGRSRSGAKRRVLGILAGLPISDKTRRRPRIGNSFGFRNSQRWEFRSPSGAAMLCLIQFPHQFPDAHAGARAGRHAPRRLPSALEPACCRCARSSPWSQRTPPRATDGKPGKSGNLFGRWTFPTLQFPGKLSLVHA